MSSRTLKFVKFTQTVCLLVLLGTICVQAAPEIKSESSSVKQILLTATSQDQPVETTTTRASNDLVGVKYVKPTNRAEKLKRGLTNFINQANPASFFVPANNNVNNLNSTPAQTSSAAEPAALVNGDPTAEAIIKGPNRLAHGRPIGGPLRWGRR